MKKVQLLFQTLVIFSLLILPGCTNTSLEEEEISNLTIYLDGDTIQSRTILPQYDDSTYYYKLSGQSQTGKTITQNYPNKTDLQNADIQLNKTQWTLTLKAYLDSECTKAVLQDTKVVNLFDEQSSVSFTLKPVETESGSFDLTIKIPEIDSITLSTIEINLKNIYTDTQVINESLLITSPIINCNKDDLESGSYTLYLYLKNSDNVTLGYYSTNVIISSNTTTEGVVDIPSAYILTPPTAPENLEVTVEEANIKFTWDDKSNNETGFVIEIEKGDNKITLNTDNMGESYIIAGGLAINNKTLTIKYTGLLDIGTYQVHIYSQNKAGKSSVATTELTI